MQEARRQEIDVFITACRDLSKKLVARRCREQCLSTEEWLYVRDFTSAHYGYHNLAVATTDYILASAKTLREQLLVAEKFKNPPYRAQIIGQILELEITGSADIALLENSRIKKLQDHGRELRKRYGL